MSKAPMRILLLNYEFPPVGGGAATASAEIAAHMVSQGAEVAVLTSHLAGLPHREIRHGYTVQRVRVMRRKPDRCSLPEMGAFIVGATVPALRLAGEFKPDVMHVFFGMPTGPVGLAVNRLKGIPYLLSLRGDDVPGRQGGALALAHRLMWPLTLQVWSRASRLVVNGEGLKQRAENTLPRRPIQLVPNGVDTELFRPRTERETSETVHLLFVGRLHRQKGLDYLLRGIAALPPNLRQRVQLELVGSGPAEEELRALVGTLCLGTIVRFRGWVPRHEIAPHYAAADIFVFPSFEEGMPNVVLEAMSSGNPVVATDIPGVRELVQSESNGLLVPPANAEAFTAALTRLMNNDE
ncbi:MAG: glycosyltransferase, partial [Chloroflexota bacterium]|nr:glycosyltransferase [Chloroflexota bacterium]